MKPGGTAELWELEDFPWLCFGGRVCVLGWGGEEAPVGLLLPHSPASVPWWL